MQYIKIKDSIVEQIESGMLLPRQKLPSERSLADSFGTTRVTLREALSLLEAEGRIYREDRRGWFISPAPLHYDLTQAQSFPSMALAQNRVPKVQLVDAKAVLADKYATHLLKLKPFSNIFQIDSVRYLEDRPVVYVINYIKADLFPNLLEHQLTYSLSDIYHQHYGITYQKVRYNITTSSLLGGIAQGLRATPGSPAMVVERLNYNHNDVLIDCDIEYWRHDAITIESIIDITT